MPEVLNQRGPGVKEKIAEGTAVYVGRPSRWGNPFVIGRDGNREEVIRRYEAWLLRHPEKLKEARRELFGKDLVCWCAPLPCHADVLLREVNPR